MPKFSRETAFLAWKDDSEGKVQEYQWPEQTKINWMPQGMCHPCTATEK